MKLSVSLPADDVAALDEYARSAGLPSRSAALSRAIRLLRQTTLERDYAAAWAEAEEAGDVEAWDATTTDGLR